MVLVPQAGSSRKQEHERHAEQEQVETMEGGPISTGNGSNPNTPTATATQRGNT